ncbi:MAG: OmpH family outer membrane protein [Alphaproteobacteria bacterium]|nr:OmpH family outer membrane protein [Alphaproteobacteria bacterium]
MAKKSFFARTILVGGLFMLAVSLQDAALAAPPPPPGGAPTARILMVDLRRVMAASKVGQNIQQQLEQLQQQARNDLKSEGTALQTEKAQLEQQVAILAPDVKNRRIKDFDARAAAFQKKAQTRGAQIQAGALKAQQQVEAALGPILQGVMQERGATILLDRSAVLIAPNAIDVTAIVVQRLDTKMPTVKVELTNPPPGSAMAQQQ